MRLPNKVTSYSDSVLGLMCPILDLLSQTNMPVYELYRKTATNYTSIADFLDVLDCLFALNKIDYCEEEGVIRFVA